MARKSPRRANRSLKEAWGPRNPGLTKSHRVFVMLDDRVQRHLLWNVFFPSNEIQRNAHVNFWIKSSISSSNPPVVCLPFVFFVGANSVIVVNGHTKNWISWFMAVLGYVGLSWDSPQGVCGSLRLKGAMVQLARGGRLGVFHPFLPSLRKFGPCF